MSVSRNGSLVILQHCPYDRDMSAILDNPHSVLPSRYAWLMGLYGENYHRLMRLFAPAALQPGGYLSSLDDHPDLRLDVIQHHKYTLDLRMTYCFTDSDTGELAPSAHLRLYHDAHMAEVLHCEGDRRWAPLFGAVLPPARDVFDRRLRLNSFLNRWLEYLADQGHGAATLVPISARIEHALP